MDDSQCKMGDVALDLVRKFHKEVDSLVEAIEECEPDGGESYDVAITRTLLDLVRQLIEKNANDNSEVKPDE